MIYISQVKTSALTSCLPIRVTVDTYTHTLDIKWKRNDTSQSRHLV